MSEFTVRIVKMVRGRTSPPKAAWTREFPVTGRHTDDLSGPLFEVDGKTFTPARYRLVHNETTDVVETYHLISLLFEGREVA